MRDEISHSQGKSSALIQWFRDTEIQFEVAYENVGLRAPPTETDSLDSQSC